MPSAGSSDSSSAPKEKSVKHHALKVGGWAGGIVGMLIVAVLTPYLQRRFGPPPAPIARVAPPSADGAKPASTVEANAFGNDVKLAGDLRSKATSRARQRPVVTDPETAEPAVAAPIVKPPEPVEDPPRPVAPSVTVAHNTEFHVRPTQNYCLKDLRSNAPMHFTLVDGVAESNGESLPPGTEVTGRVIAREAGDNDEPDRIRVALTSLSKDGATIPLVSGQTLLTMQRQSATGSVVKYSIIGSVFGAGGALVLKKPVMAGAVIGAAVGAAAGGVVAANSDVCMPASETTLQFILLKDAVVR